MGNMEEQSFDLLNMEQEDDNLLGISPANSELCIQGISPLSPSMMPKALKQAGTDDIENCYGKAEVVGAPAVVGAEVDGSMAPLPCKSPMVPSCGSKVLSALNFNEMNKRSVFRDSAEEFKSRRGFGTRESVQLDGIAETSPVINPGTFTSQLSRSYLDIENEQAGETPEKGVGEPTVLRKSRSRRSTTLRKSLAWDKAFFTDEGVLDNDELFTVASDTPDTLAMPELATIWDGPQNVVTSFEAKIAAAKTKFKSEMRPPVRSEPRPEGTLDARPEARPEVRPEVKPAVDPKPQKDVLHSSLRPDDLHTSSLRPVRQINITGSHAFSNAYSRAAAIPQGSTSIPLPNSLARTGKQPGNAVRNPIENLHAPDADVKESRNTTAGLHHQARIAALKKAHDAPPQKGPRVRLPNLNKKVEDKHQENIHKVKQVKKVEDKHLEDTHKVKQVKKVEDKHLEETNKVKQFKKVEHKGTEEVHKMQVSREKQPRKLEVKASENSKKNYATHENPPLLTRSMSAHENPPVLSRSMSASALIESPSALSRKVSSMSRRVKETLEKVMAGRARRVPKEPSLSHVHPVEKTPLPKRTGGLPTVPELKAPIHKIRPNTAVAPIKVKKEEAFTVRDILRGRGPPTSPKSKQGPTLTRSKSACAAPVVPRVPNQGSGRVNVPPAHSAASAPPPPVQPAEPIGKPTGLRKPSPKLGFFDSGRASSAPQIQAFAISDPFNCMRNNQLRRPGSEASVPTEALGYQSHSHPTAKAFSGIPTAPHLRHCVASAPTSPRATDISHPSSPKVNFTPSTRPSSPVTDILDQANFSRIRQAKEFADSHQLLAKKRVLGDEQVPGLPAHEVSSLTSFKSQTSTSAAVHPEPAGLDHGEFARSSDESTPAAVNVGRPAQNAGRKSDDNAPSLREAPRSNDGPSVPDSIHLQDSRSKVREKYHRGISRTSTSSNEGTDEELLERIIATGKFESNNVHNEFSSSSVENRHSLTSSSGRRHNQLTKPTVSGCYSPRSSSFRETSTAALDTDIAPSACPSTPTRKEGSLITGSRLSRLFESPRSKSFRETPSRSNTALDSPSHASKHVRSFSQRFPWQSPGAKVITGDSSPAVGPPTPASGGKRRSLVSPSHAPDAAGTFEVLTASSSKRAPTPGSSSKKVIRKIVEFESPSSQWSNWPVLGAAISADQLPGSGTKEVAVASPPRPSGELAREQSSEMPSDIPTSNVNLPECDGAPKDFSTSAVTDLRLSFSTSFGGAVSRSSEMDSGSMDRKSAAELNGAEGNGGPAKKERRSSMFSFARKTVARLTSSPTPAAEPSGQPDHEGSTPRSLIKIASRRFSRSSNCTTTPTEPPSHPLFSDARLRELEAAGPEILEKKTGPVQNSPPDKVSADSNPWSPVRKAGQPLGPFDCTKFNYISPGPDFP